jgi:hypothetical protein
MVVKARKSLTAGASSEQDGHASALEAIRALDRAASKGILHGNNAARRKARLARQMAKHSVAAPAPTAKAKKGATSSAPASRKAAAKPAPAAAEAAPAPAKKRRGLLSR